MYEDISGFVSKHKRLIVYISVTFLFFINIVKPFAHQNPGYNYFADGRKELGLVNFFNVISNSVYFFVGFAGFKYLLSKESDTHFIWKKEKIFF